MVRYPDTSWLVERLGRGVTLQEAEKTALRALVATQTEYERGRYLIQEGDRPRTCSYLKEGYVLRHKVVGDGGRQIVSLQVPGDFVDVQNLLLEYSDHGIQALTDVVVLTIPIQDMINAAAAHAGITKALWREALVDTAILREWATNLGRRGAYQRTAHLLCEIATRVETAGLGAREAFELPMTQLQMADTLGLTTVHVNRTLRSLEQEKLIKRDKKSVTILDWSRLRRTGDFTRSYLHDTKRTDSDP